MNAISPVAQHLRQTATLQCFDTKPTISLSKGERADLLFQGQTYDCALPSSWLDAMRKRGFDAAPHFVMLYPKNGPSYCAPITVEGMKMAALVATFSA